MNQTKIAESYGGFIEVIFSLYKLLSKLVITIVQILDVINSILVIESNAGVARIESEQTDLSTGQKLNGLQ